METSFQSHIVEQRKNYRMVVESWESVQANLNVPLFVWGTFCERLQTACTKPLTAKLMNVFGLWDLNKKKVDELLLVFGVLEVKDDLGIKKLDKNGKNCIHWNVTPNALPGSTTIGLLA